MAKPHNDLTADYVRSILDYMPETGELVWRVAKAHNVRVGAIAGNLNSTGYMQVSVDGRRYCVHRLVWLIHHSHWPENQLDHINGTTTDNRIENLRKASRAENMQNKASARNSSSRFVGVNWCAKRGKWRAQIMLNGKKKHLGHFHKEEDAADAYAVAKAAFHRFNPVARSHAVGGSACSPQ